VNFTEWLDTFVSEKELDRDHYFEVQGPEWGLNLIPLGCVLEALKGAPAQVQADVKTILVEVDRLDGNVMHFFEFVAKDMAL
jgi:hypothetical protein